MVVVSDTSPVLNLGAIGLLDLLEALFGRVIIPVAVYSEINALAHREPRFTATGLRDLPTFLQVEPLSDRALALAARFRHDLDPGEADALALAITSRADLLLVDERAARRLARQRGLITRGVLGVLIQAKRRSLVPLIAPLMEQLVSEAGFYVSASLRADVLRLAGESKN